MMMAAHKRNGFSLVEQLIAVAIFATVIVVSVDLMVQLRVKNLFMEVKAFGSSVAMQKLEEKWSAPLGTITNSPLNWSTQAVYKTGLVNITVTSEIQPDSVKFTATSMGKMIDLNFTNKFVATRLY
jgi:prepilin-type N-terminal cleavage/methylation domain-containing protein